jgi:ribosomal protein S8
MVVLAVIINRFCRKMNLIKNASSLINFNLFASNYENGFSANFYTKQKITLVCVQTVLDNRDSQEQVSLNQTVTLKRLLKKIFHITASVACSYTSQKTLPK